jgi:hypothetical protein
MKSVPPRGSGWVSTWPIVNFRLPNAVWGIDQSTIRNRQFALGRATRYREVVLTSWAIAWE